MRRRIAPLAIACMLVLAGCGSESPKKEGGNRAAEELREEGQE
jgi:hypothetical protein